jgi:uncharacterized MAPEG superfamily protein
MAAEFTVIAWLFVLMFAYIGIRPVLRLIENGIMPAIGPQDDYPEVLNKIGQRAERANHNFKETLPIALALLIAMPLAGKGNADTATAAWIYFYARAAYLPAYIVGIPGLRTLIWAVATTAIGYLAWALLN